MRRFVIVILATVIMAGCQSAGSVADDAGRPGAETVIEKPLPGTGADTLRALPPIRIDPVPPASGSALTPLPELPPAPAPSREFRAVWITTVNNGDWPSEPGLSSERQQQELVGILDRARDLNLNAVILQVRPTADAFYDSDLEPWSVFLTGKQGKAPEPFYDPLKFAVEEAHKRGLELHAWFNPFRASYGAAVTDFDDQHVSNSGLTMPYGRHLWMDPGNPDAVAHTLNVVLDVLIRYDIDGVHMDDYFYPYPVSSGSREMAFPDNASWEKSGARTLGETRSSWRRSNVNRFVAALSSAIRDIKPWVKFGISPFGIWQPGFPSGIDGFNPYEKLHADSRHWLQEGWVDYLAPQLYWSEDAPAQRYSELLTWWKAQNPKGRHLWPGNFASRITLTGDQYWGVDELLRQIDITRQSVPGGGNVLFRMSALLPADHGLGDALKAGPYSARAVVPETPWLEAAQLPDPEVRISETGGQLRVRLPAADPALVRAWIVRTLENGCWTLRIHPGNVLEQVFDITNRPDASAFGISVVDRIGREGAVIFIQTPTLLASSTEIEPGVDCGA